MSILSHYIFKQCAFVQVGPKNITMGCPNLVQEVGASHGYILKVHVNERTLLNDVMPNILKL